MVQYIKQNNTIQYKDLIIEQQNPVNTTIFWQWKSGYNKEVVVLTRPL